MLFLRLTPDSHRSRGVLSTARVVGSGRWPGADCLGDSFRPGRAVVVGRHRPLGVHRGSRPGSRVSARRIQPRELEKWAQLPVRLRFPLERKLLWGRLGGQTKAGSAGRWFRRPRVSEEHPQFARGCALLSAPRRLVTGVRLPRSSLARLRVSYGRPG